MEESLSEYWKAIKPILKEENAKDRALNYDKRINYAIEQFEKNNIPYQLKNVKNGHFNLYHNLKVVMSFWAWTGRFIFCGNGFENKSVKYDGDYERGISNCIKAYKENLK